MELWRAEADRGQSWLKSKRKVNISRWMRVLSAPERYTAAIKCDEETGANVPPTVAAALLLAWLFDFCHFNQRLDLHLNSTRTFNVTISFSLLLHSSRIGKTRFFKTPPTTTDAATAVTRSIWKWLEKSFFFSVFMSSAQGDAPLFNEKRFLNRGIYRFGQYFALTVGQEDEKRGAKSGRVNKWGCLD